MFPILLQIGTFRIYSFGVFLMLAFFWSCFLIWKNIRISKFNEETTFDLVLISCMGAFMLGRFVYIFFHFSDFGFDIMKYILINGYPGMSILGMLVGGVGTMAILCKREKISFFELSDYIVPSLFLFIAISKLGSFFAGSEMGKKIGAFRHPVALYGAALFFLGSFAAQRVLYAIRKESFSKEFPLVFYTWGYSLAVVSLRVLKDPLALSSEVMAEYWIILTLLLTSSFYFVYYFRVLIGSRFKSFINWNSHYAKTVVKVVPRKSEKTHGGGKGQNPETDRKL